MTPHVIFFQLNVKELSSKKSRKNLISTILAVYFRKCDHINWKETHTNDIKQKQKKNTKKHFQLERTNKKKNEKYK